MSLTNEQVNYLIDNYIRPEAERIRAMKARVSAEIAALPDYATFASSQDEIPLIRADGEFLPTVTQQSVRDFLYLLDQLNATLAGANPEVLAVFCVRNIEVS